MRGVNRHRGVAHLAGEVGLPVVTEAARQQLRIEGHEFREDIDVGIMVETPAAVILADASKFDRMAPGFMFGFDRVGTVVTDARIAEPVAIGIQRRDDRPRPARSDWRWFGGGWPL